MLTTSLVDDFAYLTGQRVPVPDDAHLAFLFEDYLWFVNAAAVFGMEIRPRPGDMPGAHRNPPSHIEIQVDTLGEAVEYIDAAREASDAKLLEALRLVYTSRLSKDCATVLAVWLWAELRSTAAGDKIGVLREWARRKDLDRFPGPERPGHYHVGVIGWPTLSVEEIAEHNRPNVNRDQLTAIHHMMGLRTVDLTLEQIEWIGANLADIMEFGRRTGSLMRPGPHQLPHQPPLGNVWIRDDPWSFQVIDREAERRRRIVAEEEYDDHMLQQHDEGEEHRRRLGEGARWDDSDSDDDSLHEDEGVSMAPDLEVVRDVRVTMDVCDDISQGIVPCALPATARLLLTDQELSRSLSAAWGMEITPDMLEALKGSLRTVGMGAVRTVVATDISKGGDGEAVEMPDSNLLTQSTVAQDAVQEDVSCNIAEVEFFRAAWSRGVRYGLHTLGRPTALVLGWYRQYGSPLAWPSVGDVGSGAERFRRAYIAAHRGEVYDLEVPWVENVGHLPDGAQALIGPGSGILAGDIEIGGSDAWEPQAELTRWWGRKGVWICRITCQVAVTILRWRWNSRGGRT